MQRPTCAAIETTFGYRSADVALGDSFDLHRIVEMAGLFLLVSALWGFIVYLALSTALL